MKLFANKKLFKKITILIVIITLFNVIVPINPVSADVDTDFAGDLFRPLMEMFATIGDLITSGLQWIFIGDSKIKTGEIKDLDRSVYRIRYSPGVIFSNEVPGLDANFINPGSSKRVITWSGDVTEMPGTYTSFTELERDFGFDASLLDKTQTHLKEDGKVPLLFLQFGKDYNTYSWTWNHNGVSYVAYIKEATSDKLDLHTVLSYGAIVPIWTRSD